MYSRSSSCHIFFVENKFFITVLIKSDALFEVFGWGSGLFLTKNLLEMEDSR